ncbi:MAG: 6-phosphofructokinase [Phycisphaerales bacterium]|nr:6-phosphofructokinase [Phycisphaerales bacterium]
MADRIGVLMGGGPAPGVNSVIAAATIRARLEGLDVVGIHGGYEGLMTGSPEHELLQIDRVSRIHFRGGCILGTSRANPTSSPETLDQTVRSLRALGVDRLLTIGGDDTATSAFRVSQAAGDGLRVAHVPKTIDNDLDLPADIDTFGYETARSVGVQIVQNLMVDARTTSRWYIVIAMGRKAGHLALGIGKAAGATLTVIPEEYAGGQVTLDSVADTIVGSIIKRASEGRNDGVAIIAEGVCLSIDQSTMAGLGHIEHDAHGHVRAAELDLGGMLRAEVRRRLEAIGGEATIVSKNLGYELRCADPVPADMEYTRDLGYCGAKFLIEGGDSAVITMQRGHFKPIPLASMFDEAVGHMRVRTVDVTSSRYAIARRYMIRIRRDDLADDSQVAEMAARTNLTPEAFKARFASVVENEPPPMNFRESLVCS